MNLTLLEKHGIMELIARKLNDNNWIHVFKNNLQNKHMCPIIIYCGEYIEPLDIIAPLKRCKIDELIADVFDTEQFEYVIFDAMMGYKVKNKSSIRAASKKILIDQFGMKDNLWENYSTKLKSSTVISQIPEITVSKNEPRSRRMSRHTINKLVSTNLPRIKDESFLSEIIAKSLDLSSNPYNYETSFIVDILVPIHHKLKKQGDEFIVNPKRRELKL